MDNNDDDLALADSFINFDYTPDSPPLLGSGSSLSDPPVACSSVEERFENFSLVENEVNENVEIIHAVVRSQIISNDEIRGDIIANNYDGNDGENGVIRDEIIANDDVTETDSESTESENESTESEEYELEEGEIVDSDSDSDGEDDSEETTSWCFDVDDDDDDDDQSQGLRRNELELKDMRLNLPRVPPVNVNLGPHHKMLPVGVVTSIVGDQVVVEGVEKHDPLNEGSVLWITERQTPLGLIDEIFGQVKNPYYVVRFNSEKEVPEGIREGTLISFVAEFVNHVLNNKDLYKKGYDASGQYDEEVSDEAEFSDDEKEAEYKRLQKQNKRGRNNQNTERMGNNRKQVSLKDGSIPTISVAPAGPSVTHGHCPPIPATGQGFIGVNHGHSSPLPCTIQSFFGATNVNPPFPHANGGPNVFTTGVWPNGGTLVPQQSAMCPENTQISQQLPMQGIPFQQQLPMQEIPFQQQFNPSQGFPPPTTYPGGQPNMYADPMHAQGPINQNQWSPFPQFQEPTNFNPNHISGHQGGPWLQFNQPANINPNHIAGNQGGPSLQFNPPANFHPNHISGNQGGPPHQFNPPSNFHSGSISGNQHPPQFHHQFNPGAYDGPGRALSAGRGRRPFHRGGRGWRPAR